MKTMKLSKYAKQNSVTYRTAWNRAKRGTIKTKQDELGNILVIIEDNKKPITKRAVIYTRVSSNEMKDNLKRQTERLVNWSTSNGYEIVNISEEISSGMNDDRKKLNKILEMEDYDYLIVEHKDRLARFGFNFLEKMLKKDNKEIIVVNKTIDKNEDIIKDMISIVYSFSARIYGSRKGKIIKTKVEKEIR